MSGDPTRPEYILVCDDDENYSVYQADSIDLDVRSDLPVYRPLCTVGPDPQRATWILDALRQYVPALDLCQCNACGAHASSILEIDHYETCTLREELRGNAQYFTRIEEGG